jgi:hypothetical protein
MKREPRGSDSHVTPNGPRAFRADAAGAGAGEEDDVDDDEGVGGEANRAEREAIPRAGA